MNFEDTDFRAELLDVENPFDIKIVSKFLSKNGFEYKPNEVDKTLILYNLNDEIIGTGSYKHQTLKFVVVDEKFRDSTAFPWIVTTLGNKILENYKRCFVYTRPKTAPLFEGLGYKEIARAEPLFSVLEFGYQTIEDYQKFLLQHKRETKTNKIAAIVVNCNPFTKGHLYLIEKAASENELLYLFVVEEDLSSFPYKIRREIIEEGISHLKNVVILATGPYIVSGAIFPNYFLKAESWNKISQKQAEVDVSIFAKYIIPVLNITKRYVGTENYCETTKAYNTAMKEILPKNGCELIEITRIYDGLNEENEPNYISASKIRKAIKENKLKEVLHLLPDATRKFLLSDKSLSIRNKIINSDGRH
jgi:[citrate (pro-3S)-lyase] ligase